MSATACLPTAGLLRASARRLSLMLTLALSACLMLATASSAMAADWHASPSGTNSNDRGGVATPRPLMAKTVVGGANSVQVFETGKSYASVALALADSATLPGSTVQLAPGTYNAPIVLTKSVKLVGGVTFIDGAAPMPMAGPINLPVSILDGGNVALDGITVANGVTGATISGFEIRNFARDCVSAPQGNNGLLVEENITHDCGRHGIYVNGGGGIRDVTVRNNEVYAVGNRGIVVWNGKKTDITVSGNSIHGPIGSTAIGFEDGSATGIEITDNVIDHSAGGDTGIAIMQLTSGSFATRANVIRNNQITDPGRLGIALMIPDGSGIDSGDGAIVVEGNVITGGANQGALADNDRAGIQVIRRYYAGVSQGQIDVTRGVVIRSNTVTGISMPGALAGIEGYGIVVEGLGSSVYGNTLSGNDIGVQVQQGNQPGSLPGDSDTTIHTDWFDRGNTPLTCARVDSNTISGSEMADERFQPTSASMLGGIKNETTGTWYCSFNTAIAAATAGDTLSVIAGTYPEHVAVNKKVTINGPKAGVPGSDGSRDGTGEAIIKPVSGIGISISANDVTVDGLTVQAMTASEVLLGGGNNVKVLNNRFVNSATTGIRADGPLATDWLIQGNLFDELTGTNSTAIVMVKTAGLKILGNVIHNVTYQGVQLSTATNAEIRGNNISDTKFDGINVANGNGVVIAGNTIASVNQQTTGAADRGAVRLYDGMTGVSVYCNNIDANAGIVLRVGTTSGVNVFHNAIVGGTSVFSNWTGGADIGSNWYGGGAASVGGGEAAGVQVADALPADPTNGGNFDVGECGDNTPTQIVAYAGNGQTTPINTAFGQPLVARVQDALGGAVTTPQTVTFSVPASGASASLSTLSGSTDYNGTVSTSATANGTAGDYAVSAASGSFGASAGFALTNGKMAGTLSFNPLTAPYGTLHTVTATMSPADTNVTCTAVSGVPAQSAAPGNYLVSASCEGDNTVATGTATYIVTASTAGIQPVGSAPVGVVTVDPQPDADAKKTYFSWVLNGSASEMVFAEFVIGTGNAAPHAGDVTLEYLESFNNSWQPLPLSFDAGTGTWTGVFGASTGFPLIDGVQSQFRATFQRGGRYMTTANLVGASSGLTLATSQSLATDVADIDLVGSGNAAGVVGVAVDTGYSLVNMGTAALSGGGTGNPIPAQQAPNDENVRGRFFIEWDGGALTPADPNGVGGNGSNCGAATCASPDVAVEFFDATSSSYRPIYNLRAELDGSNQPTGRLYAHFGAATSGGVPVPAGYSGTYLFRTTPKTHTGNYTVISQVVGVDTGTVYAQAADQTIGIGAGNAASIEIVGDDFDASIVGGIPYTINVDGNFRVLVRDSGGNPVDGASVAFNAPASGASAVLSAGSCTTDITGECHVTAVTNDVAGSFVIEASIANGQFVEFDLTNFADIEPGQVQITTVSGDGQTAQVGNAYGLPLAATVTDRFGNPLEGVAVEFNAPATGASVTPIGVSGLTDADGLVDSGALTANAMAGGFSVSASVDALACTSASCNVGYALTNTAAGAANVTLVSSAASAAVGTAGAYTLTASVTDDDSNPVPGVSVTLIGPSAGAGVMPAVHAGISDSAGQVMHVFDANTIAGTFQVQAVVSGVIPTDVTLTNLAGAAAKIVYVAGDGQSTPVDTAFADLVVRVVDVYDNPVADDAAAAVNFTALGSGANAAVTASVTSGVSGIAGTPAMANGTAGSYSVVASFNGHDVGFALTNTVGALSITDIVWVESSTTSIAFDGNAKAATATVTGSSLSPSFTYNGSTTAPTNAGSYQVIATIDDGNVYGTATAMLTITPAGAGNSGITLTGGSFIYDGSNTPATVSNPGGVAHTLSYDTTNGLPPVNVGSYTATLVVNDPNHAPETLTATIEITAAEVSLTFGSLSHVYDGTVKAATVTTTPAGVTGVSLAYDNTPINAGSYIVTASLSNANFVLTGPTTATLVIGKAPAQIFLSNLNHVYDGTAKAVTVSTVPAALAANVTVVYIPANPVNVGSYAVEASLVGQTNYADTTATGTLTIVAAMVAGFEIDGASTFTGIAGEALAAPLPTVRVFDTADNGVSGISVSFQIMAGGGSILGGSIATVTTGNDGLASVPGWMLGAVAGANTMTASTGMNGLATLSFNATGVQVADLTISKEVDLFQAHAGQVLTWTIEVGNGGPSTAQAELLDALPNGVDTISWTCVAQDGASCGAASGTGDIEFTSTIPAGGRIIVVISATVTAAAPTGQQMVNEAVVNWQSGGNSASATDSASLGIVPPESGPCSIFCDGFEEDLRSVALVMPSSGDMGANRVGGWQLQPLTSGKPVAALELLDASGTAVAWVDVLSAGKSQLLRLRQLDTNGAERASAWVRMSDREVLGYQWDQDMDGLVLQFVAVGKAGSVLELQLPSGRAIPQRVRLLSAVSR